MTENTKRVALVTGASRGIGKAVCLGLAKTGIHVIALARTAGALEELDDDIQSIGGTCTLMPMSLSKMADIDALGPTIAQRFGRLDILIGNAGMLGPSSPVHHIKPKDWEQVMTLNFHANIRLVRTLDPLLRQSDAGRVMFTTSGLASGHQAYLGPYGASKAAINAFVRTYASETQKTNIKVNAIDPGTVETGMLKAAYPGKLPEGTQSVEDVVPYFVDAASPECEHHGEILAAY